MPNLKGPEERCNYYELLRVSPFAPQEIISAAYRTLMSTLKKHPDLGGDTDEAAMINAAYDVLRDPEKRKAYDTEMMVTAGGAEQSKGIERRRAPRRSIEATISFCIAHDGLWYPARIKDISTLGLRLVSREPVRKGQEVVIISSNPTSQAIRGSIRWARMSHPHLFQRLYEVGVEFETEIFDIETRFSL